MEVEEVMTGLDNMYPRLYKRSFLVSEPGVRTSRMSLRLLTVFWCWLKKKRGIVEDDGGEGGEDYRQRH